jgi:toxin CcdB
MARFDVYTFVGGAPIVVDIQADMFADIGSRVVVPLAPAGSFQLEAMSRLKPILKLAEGDYILITTDIAAVPTSMLGERIENLQDQREVIVDAIDFLMQGF